VQARSYDPATDGFGQAARRGRTCPGPGTLGKRASGPQPRSWLRTRAREKPRRARVTRARRGRGIAASVGARRGSLQSSRPRRRRARGARRGPTARSTRPPSGRSAWPDSALGAAPPRALGATGTRSSGSGQATRPSARSPGDSGLGARGPQGSARCVAQAAAAGRPVAGGGWLAGAVRVWQTLTAPIYNGLCGLCWAAWAGQPGWAGVQATRPLPGPPGRPPGPLFRAQNGLHLPFLNSKYLFNRKVWNLQETRYICNF
jgi:hypothetical protein